jgi:hypothetical protein
MPDAAATTCSGLDCGTTVNNCGQTVDCDAVTGGCTGGETCSSNTCSGAVAKPDATNTGPSNPSILTPLPNGLYRVKVDNTVLENFSLLGELYIEANNVTVRNFAIDANGGFYGIRVASGSLTAEDGSITNTSSAGIYATAPMVGRRLHVYDHGADGMKIDASNSVIEYSFIEKLGKNVGAHADGDQTYFGNNIVFRYNNFYMPHPDTPNYPGEPYKANATFIVKGDTQNFLIENNWLNGGGYTIYCTSPYTRVINNKFGRDFKEGVRAGTCLEWSGNVYEDDGTPVN